LAGIGGGHRHQGFSSLVPKMKYASARTREHFSSLGGLTVYSLGVSRGKGEDAKGKKGEGGGVFGGGGGGVGGGGGGGWVLREIGKT